LTPTTINRLKQISKSSVTEEHERQLHSTELTCIQWLL